ncbi:monocarboxylate transporter 9-like [Argonauta hians]
MERPNDDDDGKYGGKYKETTQNRDLTQRHYDVSGNTSGLTRDKSDVTRTNLNTTRTNLDATRDSFDITRNKIDARRNNSDANRNISAASRNNFDVTRDSSVASQNNFDVTRDRSVASQNNFDVTRDSSVASQNNFDVNRDSSVASQNNFHVTRDSSVASHNNFDVTRDSSVASQNNFDVTRNSSGMPAYNLPDWFKWFVLAASSIINVIVTGIAFSFGVLYVKLLDEFQQGKARTAAVGSISLGLLFGAGPIAGLIANRIHSRPVAIFGSIIAAVGLLTSSYAESLEVLYVLYSILAEDINSKDKNENKRRNSGRNFEKNTSKSCNKTGRKSMIRRLLSDFMIFKNARYTIFFSSCLLSATGAGVPAIIISDYAESFGASTEDAAILVSVLGITGFIGRMLAGAASCFYKCNLFLLYFFTMLLAGVATFLIPVLELYWFCMLFAALFGLFYGVTAGLDPCLVACIAGQDNMAVSYGFFTLALGVGSLISATLAGLLRDLTGHYRSSFFMAGVFLCASSMFVLPLAIKSRLRHRHLKVPTCSCVILTRYHVFTDSVCS